MRALDALVDRVPGARLAVLLSPDGLRLGASRGTHAAVAEQVSGMVAGLWALGAATARFCADAEPRRIVTRMPEALLHVTGIRTGVVLALHTGEQSRAADIEFEVARFVTEADRHLPAQPPPPPDAPAPGAALPGPGVPPWSGAALLAPVSPGSGPVVRAGTTAPGRIRPALLAAAAAPPAPAAAGGATESEQPDLASLVLARPGTGRLPRLTPEQARIVRRCRRPLSVAEIATDLDLPVGAVRVLLDGLRRAGLVEVRDLPSHDGRPSLELLERLLTALRAW
ncbi:Roadblock/LC7 domain-containing protein [Micromonospora haikouensis]|uniref:Roadblock/LC7 domain-containing protein n=2 Tax=Micromonospora haikouensis TaxID=686309 RepID=A0A1C4X7A3_9ACTN|nr:Roadblock/LC7 domain-containing protein [Micromonospora haikouensis]